MRNVAARWADLFAAVLGGAANAAQTVEDYRASYAAVAQARVDQLVMEVAARDAVIVKMQEQLEARKKLVV
jgi:uncharacterized protein YceH (UPF0502 family)